MVGQKKFSHKINNILSWNNIVDLEDLFVKLSNTMCVPHQYMKSTELECIHDYEVIGD